MKILCVIQRFFPVIGGSELLAKTYMDHLSKRHKVTVYTTNAFDIKAFWDKNAKKIKSDNPINYEIKRFDFLVPSQIAHDDNLQNFPVPSNYPGPFSPKMWTELVLKKTDYDLIYATSFPYDHILPAYVAARKWNIPIIITPLIHQEFPELYFTATRLTILNNSDGIFVISNSEKNILKEHGIDESKISIITPVLPEQEDFHKDPQKFRNEFSIPYNSKIVLFVGSKSFAKGVIHLMKSMDIVWRNHDNVVLLLIGPDSEEFIDYFSTLRKSHKDKIINLGIVSDETKTNAYFACDIFAMPSKSESFGLTYLEAWLQGKPVIACDVSPVSDVVENEKNGLLVGFGNITQLGNTISYLIDNPKICKQYGESGKKKAMEYNSTKNLDYFEEKCISIINEFKNKKH